MDEKVKQYKEYFLMRNDQILDSDLFTNELFRIMDSRVIKKYQFRIFNKTKNTLKLNEDGTFIRDDGILQMYLNGPDHVGWVVMESDDYDELDLYRRLNGFRSCK